MKTTPSIQPPGPRSATRDPHQPDFGHRAGLPLSTSLPGARALYDEAIDRELAAQTGAAELLDRAIALDPTFSLALVARSMVAQAHGDADTARATREAARSHAAHANPWERGHVECIVALLRRQPDARDRARDHLRQHPGDLLVASQLIGDLFFHGRHTKRQAVVDVLVDIEAHHRDDWAFQSRLGFHLGELGDVDAALPRVEAALRQRPDAPFAAHAKAHVLLEAGQRMQSHRFLHDWVEAHDPAGPMDGHIHWHLSLGELESGRPGAAVERYRRFSAPGKSHCAVGLLLADAAGLFGRMALDHQPVDGIPHAQLRPLLSSLDGILAIPFVAIHAAILAVVLGDEALLGRCLDAVADLDGRRGAATELRIATALSHYRRGHMAACARALQPDLDDAFEVLGGSNEERALITKVHASANSHFRSNDVSNAPVPA